MALAPPAPPAACAPYRRTILDAAGGEELDLDDRSRAHVERCRACQDELTELLRTSRALRRLGETARRVEPPPGDWAALRSRLLAERTADRARPRRLPRVSARPLAEGLVLAIAPALVALLLAPQAGLVAGGIAGPRALLEPGTVAPTASLAAPATGTSPAGPGEVPSAAGPAQTSPMGPLLDGRRPVRGGAPDVVRPEELTPPVDDSDTPPGQDVTPAESAVAPALVPPDGSSARPVTVDARSDPGAAASPQQTLGPPPGTLLVRTVD